MASQSHMALVEGARNNHVLSHNCGGLMRLQERSKVKGLGSFARVVEAALQSMPLSDCGFRRVLQLRHLCQEQGRVVRVGLASAETRY